MKKKSTSILSIFAISLSVTFLVNPAYATEDKKENEYQLVPLIESNEKTVSKIEKAISEKDNKKLVDSVTLPFKIRIIEDSQLPNGIELIKSTGINGRIDSFKANELVVGLDGKAEYAEITWKEEFPAEDQIIVKGTNETIITGVHQKVIKREQDLERERSEAARKAQEEYAATQRANDSIEAPKWTGGGDKESWLNDAGIAEEDWGYVDYIVSHESSWNPNAVNSSSGASGLVQALPCSKVPGNCFNPVDNLRWADGYAKNRYGGSWKGAYEFWVKNRWW